MVEPLDDMESEMSQESPQPSKHNVMAESIREKQDEEELQN